VHEMDSILDDMRKSIAEIREKTAVVAASREQDRQQRLKDGDVLATARRAGEHGRDWQVLQQRMDLGQTTLDDILSGVDLSEEAKAVRAEVQKLLPAAGALFAEALEDGAGTGAVERMQQAQAQLAEALEQVSRYNRNL
jgi:hypothetical protein